MSRSTTWCVDPDQFLDLSGAVAVSQDDVRAAWEQAYAQLETRLHALGPGANLYVVFGLQGAGKTTWVEQHAGTLPPGAVVLSGPLPSRRHRARALAMARRAGCRAIGVWIDQPFEVALERNSRRSGLARISEAAMRHVAQNLEPPSAEEGFHEIIIVASSMGPRASSMAT